MRAIVYDHYGPPDVLHTLQLTEPEPGPHELIVDVRAANVTSADARIRALSMPQGFGLIGRLVFGVRAPRRRILGGELAGAVRAVGANVTNFKVGDEVFAQNGMNLGAYAERCVVSARGAVAHKPAALSFEQAAALSFGGTTALIFFRRGKLASGERLLVNGASGAVGTAAVQIAKHMGAHVTAVCSTANVSLVSELGADAVIDYTQNDFSKNGERYDLIMDTVGTAPWSRCKRSLAPGGRLLLVLATLPQILAAPWVNMTSDKRVIAGPASERAEDLRTLASLAEQGHYCPVVDRTYGMEQIVEAHTYVDTGRKRGNVVLTLGAASQLGPT